MDIDLKDKIIYEKVLVIHILGTLETLKRKKMSINEAEKFIFSPYIVNKVKKRECNDKIVNVLERGCELEDIASLLPDYYMNCIDELSEMALEILDEYPEIDDRFWIR